MDQAVSIITDDRNRSADLERTVARAAAVEVVELNSGRSAPGPECEIVIVDVPLRDQALVRALRDELAQISPMARKLFVIEEAERREQVQAHFLGATEIVSRKGLPSRLAEHAPLAAQTDTRRSVFQAERLNQNLFSAVWSGKRLPLREVEDCADLIAHNLKQEGISAWLDEVMCHHSYTHRHSMHVTGFAVAFALRYGMRDADVHRIAIGAMLHDVGKAQIPIEILDKPTALDPDEKLRIRQHAELSAQALERDGQFDAEVIDVARHHHEYIDGSGYPDALKGSDISDLVRIVAVADVYSALVDRRAYKPAIPKPRAFAMLGKMDGKLDLSLVRAFEPVALA